MNRNVFDRTSRGLNSSSIFSISRNWLFLIWASRNIRFNRHYPVITFSYFVGKIFTKNVCFVEHALDTTITRFQGNAVYNVMPDIISRLSDPEEGLKDDVDFKTIMRFLFEYVQKDRQTESLVEKLCHRFKATRYAFQYTMAWLVWELDCVVCECSFVSSSYSGGCW